MSSPVSSPAAPVTTIAALPQHLGESIQLQGWLYNLRSSGKLLFPTFRDGTGTVQGIVTKPKAVAAGDEIAKGHASPVLFNTLKSLQLESSVLVTGTVRADPRAPSGVELDVSDVHVVSAVSPDHPFPISLKEHGVDFLMEHRHLWLRTPRQSAILRVRATIMRAAAEYFDTHGFVRTDPPILTPNACEGTSELFEMDYFDDEKAYLTQSGQLYIEATALALGKVYSFGPTFRAEKSKTRRHLTEFWMVEPELAFATLDDIMDLAEAYLTHILTRVLESHRADLTTIGRDLAKLDRILTPDAQETTNPGAPPMTASPSRVGPTSEPSGEPREAFAARRAFPRLSYDEAHQMLVDAYAAGLIDHPHKDGDDFGSPDETYISSQFDQPVLIHRYPSAIKAFYMQPDPKNPALALCVDVLAPEGYGEIIGGSQRIDSYDLLKQRIEDHGLPLDAFQWYLDLRRFGSVPHGGFGMGIERVVAWICGLDHVRETIPFPRTLNRIYP